MNALVPIDSNTLDTVTGGGSSSSSNIDSLLGTLDSLKSSLSDIKTKTNGLGQGEMLILCMLAMQNRSASNVVYVGSRRPGYWW
jgi:hypothetical protein